ncbi:MAG: glycosyltransferase, partial [Pseudomonadota bacterium]|nr:glycosyltransferase [Pseudomonadota bacterium]
RGKLSFGWMPPHPTLYVRPEIYEATQGFDRRFKISGDYLSVLKIFSMQNTRIRYNPSVMVNMALGGASTKGFTSRLKAVREDYRALKLAQIGSPLTVACKRIRKVNQFLSPRK